MYNWQKQLDAVGIDFDITNLAGCTFREIDAYIKLILAEPVERNSLVKLEERKK